MKLLCDLQYHLFKAYGAKAEKEKVGDLPVRRMALSRLNQGNLLMYLSCQSIVVTLYPMKEKGGLIPQDLRMHG
jgi:hypothetical protein